MFNLPLVVGCLGTMHSFVGELLKVGLFGELDLQQIAHEVQFAALGSMVHILRRHLSEV